MSAQNSTIVRSLSRTGLTAPTPPQAPLAVRAAFGSLGALSPRTAARLARRAWFRLPAPPSEAQRSRRTPPGGRAFTVRRDGIRVSGVVYGPEDAPTAHLVHGWGGWWQQLSAHVEPLVAAGYRVVAHDALSHGSAQPGRYGRRSSTVPEMAEALAAVVWQQGPADLVVAHSIGAMAALRARRLGAEAAAYAFIAPAVDVDPMFGWFQHVLGLSDRTLPLLRDQVEAHVGVPVTDLALVRLAAGWSQDGTAPRLLAIHDRADDETPAQGSVELADAWPESDVVLTEGLGHRRILWDPQVVGRVAQFARAVRQDRAPARDRAPAQAARA